MDSSLQAQPRASEKMDYEVELAVVIGRECKDVTAEQAMDYVLGPGPQNH